MSTKRSLAAILLSFGMAAGMANAQDFRIAVSSPISSMDPHWQNLVPNNALAFHIFDTLVTMTADSKVVPALADSFKPIDATTWEVKLRKGVKFHDGTDLTADDVIHSLNRPATITRSPAPFTIYTRSIVEKKIVDASTLHLKTANPYPLLANDLAQVHIVSKKATEGLQTSDLNAGKGLIGTGPYKFVSYKVDDRVELVRNDAYWGSRPTWAKVTYRFIPNNGARVAALLAGDVDAIDQVPTTDLARIRENPNLVVQATPSLRIIYFYMDSGRDAPPNISDADGKPMTRNPFKDARVRKAVSMAINRKGIEERIMSGLSAASSHFVPPPLRAGDPEITLQPFDPDGAKKLLAEAGYPNGFTLTIHGPNNRFVNDEAIVQAVAQMLTRIGIKTRVEVMPMAVYATRGQKGDFAFGLIGWGAQTGEISSTLRAIIACESKEKGFGLFNWSRYCNPRVDELLVKALATMDDGERLRTLNAAAKLAANDGAIVPIHFQSTTWAAKKGIAIEGRADERTHAMSFSQAK